MPPANVDGRRLARVVAAADDAAEGGRFRVAGLGTLWDQFGGYLDGNLESGVLTTAVYQDLGRVMRLVDHIFRRIEDGAEAPEIELLREAATADLNRLARAIGAEESEAVEKLSRHLYWIEYWLKKGRPENFGGDIRDITQWDLPGVIIEVARWEQGLMVPGLVEAVRASWEQGNYSNAVRDSFVFLEEALRRVGGVDPEQGMSGARLVTSLMAVDSPNRIDMTQSQLAPETRGEQEGAMSFFKGAILLFRNPAVHRTIDYSPEEADEIIRVVNLCLRLIGQTKPPKLVIKIPAEMWRESIVTMLESVAQEFPGQSRVEIAAEETAETLGHLKALVNPMPSLSRRISAVVTEASCEIEYAPRG